MRARPSVPPALRLRDFRVLVAAVVGSRIAAAMVAVGVGWQVYDIRHSAFDLGLIGLAEFAPLPLLALPAGHVADRLPLDMISVNIRNTIVALATPDELRGRVLAVEMVFIFPALAEVGRLEHV